MKEVQVMLTPVSYSNSGVFLGPGAAGRLLLHLLWPLNRAHGGELQQLAYSCGVSGTSAHTVFLKYCSNTLWPLTAKWLRVLQWWAGGPVLLLQHPALPSFHSDPVC